MDDDELRRALGAIAADYPAQVDIGAAMDRRRARAERRRGHLLMAAVAGGVIVIAGGTALVASVAGQGPDAQRPASTGTDSTDSGTSDPCASTTQTVLTSPVATYYDPAAPHDAATYYDPAAPHDDEAPLPDCSDGGPVTSSEATPDGGTRLEVTGQTVTMTANPDDVIRTTATAGDVPHTTATADDVPHTTGTAEDSTGTAVPPDSGSHVSIAGPDGDEAGGGPSGAADVTSAVSATG